MRWLLLLLACSWGDGPPDALFAGHWTVRGEPVGQAFIGLDEQTMVVTSRYGMTLDGERFDWQVEERATSHPEGGLSRWTLTRGVQEKVEVTFDPPWARWTYEDADGPRNGSFPITERPLWPTWPDVLLGPDEAVTVWDGASLRVRDAVGTVTRDDWRLQAGPLRWTGTFGEDGAVRGLTVPGEGRLQTGDVADEAPDAVGLARLTVQGMPQTDPRRWVALDARWADGTQVEVRRPHPLELPKDAVAPEPEPPVRGVMRPIFGVDLGIDLPGGAPRRQVVQAVIDALSRRIIYRSTPRRPTVTGTLQSGEGDCDDLSTVMVGALDFEGVPARVAHGLLITKDGLVPHAWVEVWYGSAGWVPADPSFRQVVADAGRVRLGDPRLATTRTGPLRVEKAR